MTIVIDWSQLRQNTITAAQRSELYSPNYWNKEACAVNQTQPHWAELTKTQLKQLPINEQMTVLDVGAGAGRITLPVAKKAKHVTALEPSAKSLVLLKENAKKQGIINVSYVNQSLETFDCSQRHDLVVASFSLFMFDLKAALKKMDVLANRSVYLFVSASPWLNPDLQKLVYGAPGYWSDFIFLYNILYEMDIAANVEITDYTLKESYQDLAEASEKISAKFHIPQTKTTLLCEYLQRHLVEEDDRLWSIQKRKAATVWWNKKQ